MKDGTDAVSGWPLLIAFFLLKCASGRNVGFAHHGGVSERAFLIAHPAWSSSAMARGTRRALARVLWNDPQQASCAMRAVTKSPSSAPVSTSSNLPGILG